jgi:hypothetical protein
MKIAGVKACASDAGVEVRGAVYLRGALAVDPSTRSGFQAFQSRVAGERAKRLASQPDLTDAILQSFP